MNPDVIVSRLAPLSKQIWTGLEAGAQDVNQYFRRRAHDLSRPVQMNYPLATDLVRYNTLCYLEENRPLGAEYYLRYMTNNGISLRSQWYSIKVYKMLDGECPVAHDTKASRAFYGANGEPYLPNIDWSAPTVPSGWKEIAPTLFRVNLIYCWQADPRLNIIHLKLFCPRKSGKYKEGVRLWWSRSIAHPITGIKVPTVNDVPDVEDLPIIFFEDAGEEDGDD